MRSRPPFVRMRLTSRSSSGQAKANRTGSNNGGDSCAGSAEHSTPFPKISRCRSSSRRQGRPFTKRRPARCAPKGGNSKSSAQARTSRVLAAAAAAGLGVTPMVEGLAPEGLKPCLDSNLRFCPRSRCCSWRVREPWRSRAADGSQAWSRRFKPFEGRAEAARRVAFCHNSSRPA